MSKDEKETASAEAPKKSKKMLMIIVIAAVVLLGGGGAGAFFMLKGDSAEAAVEKPVKGAVLPMEDALTINLKGGHYLKLKFTLQLTEAAGEEAPDISQALGLAIDLYTDKGIDELQTEKGRDTLKAELLKEIEEAYYNEEEKTQVVMDLYITNFVTQ